MTEGERDSEVLALQIGRPLRAASKVLRRCNLGLPIVAEVPPILDTGEPFPTRYWLTCPLAHRRIARLEGGGGVRAAQAKIDADPALREAVEAAGAHATERQGLAHIRGAFKVIHSRHASPELRGDGCGPALRRREGAGAETERAVVGHADGLVVAVALDAEDGHDRACSFG